MFLLVPNAFCSLPIFCSVIFYMTVAVTLSVDLRIHGMCSASISRLSCLTWALPSFSCTKADVYKTWNGLFFVIGRMLRDDESLPSSLLTGWYERERSEEERSWRIKLYVMCRILSIGREMKRKSIQRRRGAWRTAVWRRGALWRVTRNIS